MLRRLSKLFGFLWARVGDFFLLKEIVAGSAVVSGLAVTGIIRIFSPLSFLDFMLVTLLSGGSAYWFLLQIQRRALAKSPPTFEHLSDEELKLKVSKWLCHKLSRGVATVDLFGSIVHEHYKTSDIDIIVRFKVMPTSKIAQSVRNIRGKVAKDFEGTFGHKLHVQFFCSNEVAKHEAFRIRAGKWESIKAL